jgi:uncharacterized damage-inducible protein DinB
VPIAQNMLNEFDNEMANTRKTLERLPEDKIEYKPDPKSMSLGRLAGHVTEMVTWGTTALTTDELDLNPATYPSLHATSREQILAEFDKNVAASRAALAAATDEKMLGEWQLKVNGKTMMAMPRVAVIRVMVMNHIIHHRAQLTVYYRLNGIPVPALYGPSADEGMPVAADAAA